MPVKQTISQPKMVAAPAAGTQPDDWLSSIQAYLSKNPSVSDADLFKQFPQLNKDSKRLDAVLSYAHSINTGVSDQQARALHPELFPPGGTVPPAPKGYKTLTIDQRNQWNNFLDYLGKQGLAGNPSMDLRDKSIGLAQLKAYQKANPSFGITADMIPYIQYEHQLLRKGSSFPTLSDEQLKAVQARLSEKYKSMPISDTDGWLGSLTSKQYYPKGSYGANTGEQKDFGTDIEGYSNWILAQTKKQ